MLHSRALRTLAGIVCPTALILALFTTLIPTAAEAADPCTTDPTGFACFLEAQANGLATFIQQQAAGLEAFAIQEANAIATPVEEELQQLVTTVLNEVTFIESLPPVVIAVAESTIATVIADAQDAIQSAILTAEQVVTSTVTTAVSTAETAIASAVSIAETTAASAIATAEQVVAGFPGSVTTLLGSRPLSSAVYSQAFFFCSGAAAPAGSLGEYVCSGPTCAVTDPICTFEEEGGEVLFLAGNVLYSQGF